MRIKGPRTFWELWQKADLRITTPVGKTKEDMIILFPPHQSSSLLGSMEVKCAPSLIPGQEGSYCKINDGMNFKYKSTRSVFLLFSELDLRWITITSNANPTTATWSHFLKNINFLRHSMLKAKAMIQGHLPLLVIYVTCHQVWAADISISSNI